MTTLVVQAHPLEESYNAEVRSTIVGLLERRRRPVDCYRLGQGERPEADDLAEAGRLVLVYPTWSGGLPAMLLDWVHEVLDDPNALSEVHTLTAVTTCGSSKFINLLQGEWGRKYLKTTLLAHCRQEAGFNWLPLYKIDRRTRQQTTDHLGRLERRLSTW